MSDTEDTIQRLRGQLQNCVNHLDRLKRKVIGGSIAAQECIESANKALYETLHETSMADRITDLERRNWELEELVAILESTIQAGMRIDAKVAQQEAQPVASVPQDYLHDWDDSGERCLKCGDKDWFAGPSCEGESQASVPQGMEGFIVSFGKKVPAWTASQEPKRTIHEDDLRTWMAGHARVPVEPNAEMKIAAINIDIGDEFKTCLTFEEAEAIYKAMLTASKESV